MIDRNTVQQILDAADIVEVVSDFVNLRRRGANYVGLCPFHNEKTPSFSVNKARGICKCFSCGKGGGAVNFIMEHEKLSYYEALKYLAAKYHIEVKEKELTDEEKQSISKRENMLAANDLAMHRFEYNLKTDEGVDVGLSYFRERGISDSSIATFHLGYSLDKRDDLFNFLHKDSGVDSDIIFETGLCSKSNYGDSGFDRFKGRVMFPVFNIAGKVVAFGGRTLKNDPAKYVNSPESLIYNKRNELYGLFQAKKAIVDNDKCFLVEGYTDVISMHQSGIKNVVASSGTSLTDGQIRLLHRFTNNVTVLYDGDSAGIKASLRGIDLLLAEGLNIKVLLLPDGEDPDSFARSHSATELADYIAANETDFIKFKIRILLDGVADDPIRKASVISDMVRSISVIPDRITQSVYAKECSVALDVDEKLLWSEINKAILTNKKKSFEEKQKEAKEIAKAEFSTDEVEPAVEQNIEYTPAKQKIVDSRKSSKLIIYEKELIRLLVRYGMMEFCQDGTTDGSSISVADFIIDEMAADAITFSKPEYIDAVAVISELKSSYESELARKIVELDAEFSSKYKTGIEEIGNMPSLNIEEIKSMEDNLAAKLANEKELALKLFRQDFVATRLISHPSAVMRTLATDLVGDKYKLSKIYTKSAAVVEECDRLGELVPMAINNWKNAIITSRIEDIHQLLKNPNADADVTGLLTELQQLNRLKIEFAAVLGERVVLPRK